MREEWLIIPSRVDWPAYRPAKYITDLISADDPKDNVLLVGYYVEKGYTGDAARAAVKANCVMESDWAWHDMLDGFRSGGMANAIESLPEQCLSQLQIRISAGLCGYDYKKEWADYRLSVSRGKANFAVEEKNRSKAAAVTNKLAEVETWGDLTELLDRFNEEDWLWVNLYINLRLHFAGRSEKCPAGLATWTDLDIWDRYLKAFLPWVREYTR